MRNDTNPPMTVGEAARALGLSIHTVRAWIAHRRLPHIRLGRAIRILPTAIEELINNSLVPAWHTPPSEDPSSPAASPVVAGREKP